MAATAAANRPPPAHPGPDGRDQHTFTNSGGPTPQQQVPGPHGTSQDPGPSSHPHHHVSARPVFYVQAPPPPPFLHYQWPMPFSYNPFTGFPGMGYGMMMPPFPPPPHYMEAPAYIMPHPHMQPVDYRRFHHPQVHPPCAPYQNLNQSRRVRVPPPGPVRETVSCEVQTEPQPKVCCGDRSPIIGSDSGRGTASNSPSPSHKGGSAQVEDYIVPSSNATDNATAKRCFNILHPVGIAAVRSHVKEALETQKNRKESVGQENVVPCRNAHFNMWSVDSPDSLVPVCSSSQQEEEVVKERRVSVPDILMSWGGGTPPATMSEKLPENEDGHESAYQSPAETRPVDCAFASDAEGNLKDGASLFKIIKLKVAHEAKHAASRRDDEASVGPPVRDDVLGSPNASNKETGDETNPHEDTVDVVPCQTSLNSFQMKRKLNESVWSVESLAPFIPSKEWLLQNGMFEPRVIVEMTEEAEGGSPTHDAKESTQILACSSSESVLISDSWLSFSTPAGRRSPPKRPEVARGSEASEMRRAKRDQSTAPSEKGLFVASTCPPPHGEIVFSSPSEEEVDKTRSSEPEAYRSPNQEAVVVNEQQQQKVLEETHLRNSPAGQLILRAVDTEVKEARSKEVSQPRESAAQPSVPPADQKVAAAASLAKASCVNCSEFKEWPCFCEQLKRNMGPGSWQHFKSSDVRMTNDDQAEGLVMKGQNNPRRYHRRNKGPEKPSGQQEAYNGHYSKPGKPRGGKGRNSRY